MTFADTAKYLVLRYSTFTFGKALDHLFGVVGSGYSWRNGELVSFDEPEQRAMLPALERAACLGVFDDRALRVPRSLRWLLGGLPSTKPRSAQERLQDKQTLWYHASESSAIYHIPDNVAPDWLAAALVYLGCSAGVQEPGKLIQSLWDRFPSRHRVPLALPLQIQPRPDSPGAKYWPVDEVSLVPLADIVEGFQRALEFCYRITPRSSGEPQITSILLDTAARAVDLGIHRIAQYLPRNGQRDIFAKYDRYRILPFNDINLLRECCTRIRRAYRLTRHNINKDIPYDGYPDGGWFHIHPREEFTTAGLRYQRTEHGRSALETIVLVLVRTVAENGRRIVRNDFLEAYKHDPIVSEND